jgi:hypothetical protein
MSLPRAAARFAVCLGAFAAFSFAAFLLLELRPGMLEWVNLRAVKYYAQTSEYAPDPALVFVPRRGGGVYEGDFRGDLYSDALGVPIAPIHFRNSFTGEGFRVNGATAPFGVVVIGDSYVQNAASDDGTFSELIRGETGLPALNLGRAWYGPYQYLEVFKRYGLKNPAKFVVLCFFDGNDIADIAEYNRWRAGGDYYGFSSSRKGLLARYGAAMRDSGAVLAAASGLARRDASDPRDDLAYLELKGKEVPVVLHYFNKRATPEELLRTREWRDLRGVLAEFKGLCLRAGKTPIVVFVPTKAETYAGLVSPRSGRAVASRLWDENRFGTNSEQALGKMTGELRLRFVDLLPEFRERARDGELLYHPFDTHWNTDGRRAAATLVAREINGGT